MKKSIMVILFFALFMVGCSSKVNPAEEIYHHLEAAVNLEAQFEQQQELLSNAELKEYELYEEILNLADLEEIKFLANEAKQIALTRKEMIEKEKQSIVEAYEEFTQVTPIIETFEDENLKQLASELVTIMNERYETYLTLFKEYKEAIDLDIELYVLVQKEDLTIDELEAQHEKVNASYERVNHYKEQFNLFTVQYNDLKRNFYQTADLEVVYRK